ncbi:MAG: phage holin, LLH family [Alphaproteobacteria bacterium]|jgi:hypothetical protein
MFKKILRWFRAGLNDILDALEPLAKQMAKSGGKLLINAALVAVQAAENAGGSSDEKLTAARKMVVKHLQDNGLPIVMNAINGAIEMAVARLNENK